MLLNHHASDEITAVPPPSTGRMHHGAVGRQEHDRLGNLLRCGRTPSGRLLRELLQRVALQRRRWTSAKQAQSKLLHRNGVGWSSTYLGMFRIYRSMPLGTTVCLQGGALVLRSGGQCQRRSRVSPE